MWRTAAPAGATPRGTQTTMTARLTARRFTGGRRRVPAVPRSVNPEPASLPRRLQLGGPLLVVPRCPARVDRPERDPVQRLPRRRMDQREVEVPDEQDER